MIPFIELFFLNYLQTSLLTYPTGRTCGPFSSPFRSTGQISGCRALGVFVNGHMEGLVVLDLFPVLLVESTQVRTWQRTLPHTGTQQ